MHNNDGWIGLYNREPTNKDPLRERHLHLPHIYQCSRLFQRATVRWSFTQLELELVIEHHPDRVRLRSWKLPK